MTKNFRLVLALHFLAACLWVPGWAGAADAIAVLAPERQGASGEFTQSLVAALGRVAAGVQVRVVSSAGDASSSDIRLVIAVGSSAQQAIAAQPARPQVLATLAPRATYERLFDKAGRTTALYLDQPKERQLGLLTLLPSAPKSVGVVFSSGSSLPIASLRAAAGRLGLRLVEVPVTPERDVAAAVQEAASQAEFLLAHPDPGVFGPQTIQNILLTTYRARVPMLGFSPAYTRAGALLSLHSSPAQLAEQAADMAKQTLQSGSLPAPQYPRDYEVSVNRQVARSLGIDLPAEGALVERLRQKERSQ